MRSSRGEGCLPNPMWNLQLKLKKMKARLSIWSRKKYGDIYEDAKNIEKNIDELEQNLINSEGTRTLLNKTKADDIQYLKVQDSILKQKARVKWLSEGDQNTTYFHSSLKDRRRRLHINKIQDKQLQWVEGNEDISKAAVRYFKGIFCQTHEFQDMDELKSILPVVNDATNMDLIAMPSTNEIKEIVFTMDPDSAPGLDGITAKFFQVCWDIISKDITLAIQAFFCGASLPSSFTHTCIVMLPKVPFPPHFSDIRPISLCKAKYLPSFLIQGKVNV